MKNTDRLLLMLKAVDNASEGITISDASLPDNPLIYVNKGFVEMTGYSYEECIGRNCRYLQGKDTDPAIVDVIREAIRHKKAAQIEMINYRKNGEPFWNYFSITPILNENDVVTHFIGVQEDVTLKRRQEELERQIIEQKLIARITEAVQEKERQELGKELHDNINQLLATVRLYLVMAQQQPDAREELIVQTKELTDKAIEEIRILSKRLVAPLFGSKGLLQAVADLIATVQPAVPFRIELTSGTEALNRLQSKQQLMLYRIIQEQLQNIIKHAKAHTVHIHFTEDVNLLRLSIKDDGVGFDIASIHSGIGLRNMQNRVAAEGGHMQLLSGAGEGCTLLITLPL